MKILARCAAALFLLAGLALFGVWAWEYYAMKYAHKSSGPVVVLPPPEDMREGTLHFPGREYRSGDDWWSLACDCDCDSDCYSDSDCNINSDNECELRPIRLVVTPRSYPMYEGPDVPGQMLRFIPVPPAGTLLVFKPFRAQVFEAGPVETWRIGRATQTSENWEGQIALADGRFLRFVPTLLTPPTPPLDNESRQEVLELVLDGQRQTLPYYFSNFDEPERYVPWIGDLDRDGKPDFVVKLSWFRRGHYNFALFLSSLAKPGEIVGLAGRFFYGSINAAGC
jgi:hypothetical protein